MIIGTGAVLDVGFRGVGLADADGTYHEAQPFVVERLASYDEWLAQLNSADRLRFGKHAERYRQTYRFYRVSVD